MQITNRRIPERTFILRLCSIIQSTSIIGNNYNHHLDDASPSKSFHSLYKSPDKAVFLKLLMMLCCLFHPQQHLFKQSLPLQLYGTLQKWSVDFSFLSQKSFYSQIVPLCRSPDWNRLHFQETTGTCVFCTLCDRTETYSHRKKNNFLGWFVVRQHMKMHICVL